MSSPKVAKLDKPSGTSGAKISEKTGGAYADMGDVINSELGRILGGDDHSWNHDHASGQVRMPTNGDHAARDKKH